MPKLMCNDYVFVFNFHLYGENENVIEVILALSATVDGQTTAHYVADCLKDCDVMVSRLGHGVPVGGELDYMDEGTLAAALSSRQKI